MSNKNALRKILSHLFIQDMSPHPMQGCISTQKWGVTKNSYGKYFLCNIKSEKVYQFLGNEAVIKSEVPLKK